MNWQYRTVLFEFRKDGLLGDRYIDHDEMENILNDLGREGWELVSVTPVQDGLLAFVKRVLPQLGKQTVVKPAASIEPAAGSASSSGKPVQPKSVTAEKAGIASPKKQPEKQDNQPDAVGGIKIS